MTNKVHYLNSHLEKYRNKDKVSEIKIDLETVEQLPYHHALDSENKKIPKLFIQSFKNKEDYKALLLKLPKDINRYGLYYLITVYWIAFVHFYYNDKFYEAMGECLESIDENIVLLNSTRFCKKVFCYLNPIDSIK